MKKRIISGKLGICHSYVGMLACWHVGMRAGVCIPILVARQMQCHTSTRDVAMNAKIEVNDRRYSNVFHEIQSRASLHRGTL